MKTLLLTALVVGSWNGNWFPSGRAEHRAHPDVEAATITAAAKMLSHGIKAVDPKGTNDIILVLNEIRNAVTASNLLAQINRRRARTLSLAAISAYRRRDRFDTQQDLIATTLPVLSSGWSKFPRPAPRGFAFADLLYAATTTRVWAVHLKSNYGATTPEIRRANTEKRTVAIRALLAEDLPTHALLAGDFNADAYAPAFATETIFSDLDAAGFANFLSLAPPNKRGTHPNKRYGDSALDYIFARSFTARSRPHLEPNDELSDHLALFILVDLVR